MRKFKEAESAEDRLVVVANTLLKPNRLLGTFLSLNDSFSLFASYTPYLLRLDGTRSLQYIVQFLNSTRRRQRKFSQFLARAFMVFKERLGNDHALTRQARTSLEATVARQYEEASDDLREVGGVSLFARCWGLEGGEVQNTLRLDGHVDHDCSI